MIPLGYMAKCIPEQRPDWLPVPQVRDIYSVSDCVNDSLLTDLAERETFNGYWLFNSSEEVLATAAAHGVDLEAAKLFYYEAYELEWDGEQWTPFLPDPSFDTHVVPPHSMQQSGFDAVTSCDGFNSHSPLSCNRMAKELMTNAHCLFETFAEAQHVLERNAFNDCEPGPYQIYAVYSVEWP